MSPVLGYRAASDDRASLWRITPYYLVGVAIVLGIALFSANRISQRPKQSVVFASFWTSGYAANHGADPYAVQPDTYRVPVKSENVVVVEENLNPPCVLPLFQALAWLPISIAAWVYTACSFVFLVVAGAIMIALNPSMQRLQAAWILLSAPVLPILISGQMYAVLLLLSVVMWAALRGRRIVLAAICLGVIVAVKPIFAIWILLVAARGQLRIAWRAAVTAACISLLPVLLYGPAIYGAWLRAARHDQHYLFLTNISLVAVGRRFGLMAVGYAAAILLLIACLYATRARVLSPRGLHMMGIAASCLCGPLGWYMYLILAYPWFLERKWDRLERQGAAVLLLIPSFIPSGLRWTEGPSILLWIGSAMCIAPAVLLLVDAVRSDRAVESRTVDEAALAL